MEKTVRINDPDVERAILQDAKGDGTRTVRAPPLLSYTPRR